MAIFDELKSVANTLREADKIPQYQQILDVLEKLIEMQNKIFTLENENKILKESLKVQESLVFENNSYWTKKGEEKTGPFCTRCWDVEKNIVRLNPSGHNQSFHSCPECKNTVQTNPNFRSSFIDRGAAEDYR